MYSPNFWNFPTSPEELISVRIRIPPPVHDTLDVMAAAIASGVAVGILFPVYLITKLIRKIVRRSRSTPTAKACQVDS